MCIHILFLIRVILYINKLESEKYTLSRKVLSHATSNSNISINNYIALNIK